MNQAQIISFYSVKENAGKATLSQSLAKHLSYNNKVLFIETDYKNPKLAITTGLNDSEKNLAKLVMRKENFNLLDYVSTNKDSKHFDFIGIPKEEVEDVKWDMDSHQLKDFVSTLVEALRNTSYEYVIINLPHELTELLSYSLLALSDSVVNIIGANPAEALKFGKQKEFLETHNLMFEAKQYTVFNYISENTDSTDALEALSQMKYDVCVPYDSERQANEFILDIGSPLIDLSIEKLIRKMNLNYQDKQIKKKGFFKF